MCIKTARARLELSTPPFQALSDWQTATHSTARAAIHPAPFTAGPAELQEPRGSTRTRLPARSLLTPRGTRRQRWQQPRGYYHMRITEGPRAEGARKASSQRVKGLQEPQGAPTATRHQQEVPRAPGGQRQQSSTTTNHGPQGPMFEDSAGQVPGLTVTAKDVRPGLTVQYVPGCKTCLLYTSPSPRDGLLSRMPSSA